MRSRPEIGCGLLLLALGVSGARAELQVGDALPDLDQVVWSDGTPPPLQGRVVLLDFWASWCAPCKAAFPTFANLQREYGEAGLVVIGVGVDKSASAYAQFVAKTAPPFVTLHDGDQRLVRMVRVPAMPTSYLFDRRGRLRFIHRGFYGDKTAGEMRDQIEVLLNEQE